MSDHDDARIDEALEALAHPDVPAHHVPRVLARTGPSVQPPAGTHDQPATVYLRPRWVLPVAATLLVTLGATWQIERQARGAFDDVVSHDASTHASARPPWGMPEEVVRPVLPPQAYWGMDPFHEFARLRPGTRVTADAALLTEASPRKAIASAQRVDHASLRHVLRARQTVADDELTWGPASSGLPSIEVVSIVPAPLVAAPVAPTEYIALAAIPLAPIVITPLAEQENP